MTVAIGGWLLLAVAACPTFAGPKAVPGTIQAAVSCGQVVKGYDTAEDCEGDRKAGQVCVPALATVNR